MQLPSGQSAADLTLLFDARYLALTGGHVSGPVTVPPPTQPNDVATKAYVDSHAGGGGGPAGPAGPPGPKGDAGQGIQIVGTVAGAGTALPQNTHPGDVWILGSPTPTAAPARGDGTAAQPGDGIVSNGAGGWTNVGPLRGPEGPTGPSGQSVTGPPGQAGAPGSPGAAATVTVGATLTGTAGSAASVVNSGTSSAAVLDFTVPAGPMGPPGADGGASAGAWNPSKRYNAGDMVTHPAVTGGPPVVWVSHTDNLLGPSTAPGAVPGQWKPLALDLPDTGWRDLGVGVLRNQWKLMNVSTAAVKIRRYGAFVFLQTGLECPAVVTSTHVFTVPNGFHGVTQQAIVRVIFAGANLTPTNHVAWVQVNAGALNIYADSPNENPLGGIVGVNVMWPTTDPWPTVMPGTQTTAPA